MTEAVITAAVALAGGFAALNNRIHNRITNVHKRIDGLDRRVDGIELAAAQSYVTKDEISRIIERVEGHMVRIEEKLDRAIRNGK